MNYIEFAENERLSTIVHDCPWDDADQSDE